MRRGQPWIGVNFIFAAKIFALRIHKCFVFNKYIYISNRMKWNDFKIQNNAHFIDYCAFGLSKPGMNLSKPGMNLSKPGEKHNNHVMMLVHSYFNVTISTQSSPVGERYGMPLLWRHNGRGSVSNRQTHDCLLNRLFRRRSLAFVRGIHRGPMNSPHKWSVTRQMFPFDDVIMFISGVILWSMFYVNQYIFCCIHYDIMLDRVVLPTDCIAQRHIKLVFHCTTHLFQQTAGRPDDRTQWPTTIPVGPMEAEGKNGTCIRFWKSWTY